MHHCTGASLVRPLRAITGRENDSDRFRNAAGHMTASVTFSGSGGNDSFEVLREDTERTFCMLRRNDADGSRHAFIPALSGADHSTLESINRPT